MQINFAPSFKGTPLRIPTRTINGYQDALKDWELLKSAKYLDAHLNSYHDKWIRSENYSFLDKLNKYSDKSEFVAKFCEFTKFPILRNVCDKMDETFKECLNKISRELGEGPYKVLDYGYDPTCSVGLRKSFPGSDLDKGYVILEGYSYNDYNKSVTDNFKGKLWEHLDQRIVSLNHPNTEISVYTKSQIQDKLDALNAKASGIVSSNNMKAGLGLVVALTVGSFFGPFGITLASALAGGSYANHLKKRAELTDPYEAGIFNRKIAEMLSTSQEREDAKNFAFFIETVNANIDKDTYRKTDKIFETIKESPFVQLSNVTQIQGWQNKINNGYLKAKLRNREKLERDFNSMTNDTRYELVKDIIKYSTDDQSSKFSEYFKNDDDIAARYDRLLNALK